MPLHCSIGKKLEMSLVAADGITLLNVTTQVYVMVAPGLDSSEASGIALFNFGG
jgi:hypothetical protein